MKKTIINILILLILNVTVWATTYQHSNSGIVVSWVKGDFLGVYTADNMPQRKYLVYSVSDDSHYALIRSTEALVENAVFYAYFPYNSSTTKVVTQLPAVYTSQKQLTNRATNHLASCDYQMSTFNTNSGASDVNFSHIGSIINISWTIPSAKTLTGLTLSADDDIFTTEATMNLIDQTTTSVTKSNSVTLSLDNISIAENGTLDAYMFIFPDNLVGQEITVILKAADGSTLTAKIYGTAIQAGKLYPITIGSHDTKIMTSSSAKKLDSPLMSTTSIAALTAYSPDFHIDNQNKFTTHSLLGDVNKDGTVDMQDVLLLEDFCLGKNFQSADYNVADINGDKKLNIVDLALLINILKNNSK